MGAPVATAMSEKQYLELIRDTDGLFEYFDGELFPMIAASQNHSLIAANATISLGIRLRNSPCRAFTTPNVPVKAKEHAIPDIAIVRGKPVHQGESKDNVVNPKVLIEVLSPSTADFDYGGKFQRYRGLATLEEYVLIAQDAPRVEIFRLTGGSWVLTSYSGLDAVAELASIGVSLPLAEIYGGVEFEPESATARGPRRSAKR